ncbi:MAG: tRNA pseudouridine(13) synthase TruD [Marinobacter sp.]|nr:tRNA pseudouridine(13) synthase TruD [Marinobacter sp.]
MNPEPEWRLDWPTTSGKRLASASIKAVDAHFQVDEELDLEGLPAELAFDKKTDLIPGSGEHLFIRIEKRGDNTDYVARELARLSGCKPHDIGFCGLKDRHAVTRQWFSVYRPGMTAADSGFLDAVAELHTVLAACRFPRKLRRGDHQGNRFDLVLTEVDGDRSWVDQRLGQLQVAGCPNYYGPQRFGWGGNNLRQAVRLRPGRQRGRNSRTGLYFSAARSWLFNEVLAERVALDNWRNALTGEPDASGPTGPLWGDGGTDATGPQGELERSVVSRHPQLVHVFSETRMKPERRPLVLFPDTLSWRWLDETTLALSFGLLPGQFATSVLADIFTIHDRSGGAAGLAEDA